MPPQSITGLENPPAAGPPYYDESRGEWVVSRYRDVLAALREPLLWPAAQPGDDSNSGRDDSGRLLLRGASQEALAHVEQWEAEIAPTAHRALNALPYRASVDLLSDFALPWCLQVALLVVQAAPEDFARLAHLGTQVFAATGAPDDSLLKLQAAAATAELVRMFEKGPLPMGEPTFVAISQTSPRMLANIWLALYRNPVQADRLRANPGLWPCAADELLRYAGIVRRIRREARGTVEVAGVTIAEGQRVMLMLASANRDPEHFAEADRLDVGRSLAGHVALGMGRNSCIGAALIRSLIRVSTRALLERFPAARVCDEPAFRIGSGYCFPTSVPVLLAAG
jgi:cytochrome P450